MKTTLQKCAFGTICFGLLLTVWRITKLDRSWVGLQSRSSLQDVHPQSGLPGSRQFVQELEEQKIVAVQDIFRQSENSSWHNSTIFENNASNLTEEQSAGSTVCGEPKHNIVFFKMHKCSSSTVQNILMRYGDKQDLNFVLPPRGNYLGHGEFNKRAMLSFPVKEYNILCHHTRFSFQGMSEVMPKNSVWTTIIRDPVYMFESSFYYMNMDKSFHIRESDPLATFAENPSFYVTKYGRMGKGKNPMLFDLGLSDDKKDDINFIKEMIAKLDGYFDLVLVTEYFEESLILFKELMCWELDDIAYFVVNARAKNSIHKITDKTVENLRKWNLGDQMLYEHFNGTLWKKIEAFGIERMKKEVTLLKARNEELEARCIMDPSKTVNKGGIWHPGGIDIKGFVVKPGMEKDQLCKGMAMAELKFTAYLLQKQKTKYGMH